MSRGVSFIVDCTPVGVNSIYKIRRGFNCKNQMYMTAEGKSFKAAIATAAREAMAGRKPLEGPCSVFLTIHYKSKRNDIDAALKPILDSLQAPVDERNWETRGGVYCDDNQVVKCVVDKQCDPKRPRVAVFVSEVADDET